MINKWPSKKQNRIFIIALTVLFLFDLKILSTHAWDPRSFILERPEDLPANQTWGVGYDGRFSYALAVHPFGSTRDLDQPAYRYQRIVYPLLARLLALGQPAWIPWTLIAINLIAAGLCCSALGELLRRRGASPWLALVFVLSLGFLLALRLDLLEPLALSLALLGWLAWERERRVFAVLLFAVGGLTKEIALVFPLGLVLWETLRGEWRRGAGLALGSAAPYLAWFLVLRLWFGSSPTQVAQSTLSWPPFMGIRFLENPISISFAALWVIGPAILVGAWALRELFLSFSSACQTGHPIVPARGAEAVLVLAQVVFLSVMPALTWSDPLAVVRTGLGLLATSLVWLAGAHPRLLPYAAALWLPSSLILFLVPGML